MDTINPQEIRNRIVGLDTLIPLGDKEVIPINFDNAATTPPFKSVMKAIELFAPWYSSIHRGAGYKSIFSSRFYEHARNNIADFAGATPDLDTVLFMKNTTEAINVVANSIKQYDSNAVILSTFMEHHSNDLPWRNQYDLDYIDVEPNGTLCFSSLEQLLIKYGNRVKLITVTAASNVTGYINDVDRIAEMAHEYGAKILVDGAQLIPHHPFSMKDHALNEHIDFLVFSAHKMYAPFGCGVLIGPTNFFANVTPFIKGGGTVKVVTPTKVLYDCPPNRHEGGTPNIMGVVALDAAIKELMDIGLEKIKNYENQLLTYAFEALIQLPFINLTTTDQYLNQQISVLSFNVDDIPHETVAHYLSINHGIAVRNGCFCAQPYVQKLLDVSAPTINSHLTYPFAPHPGLVRISFGMYNTTEEIDKLIIALKDLYAHKDQLAD